MLRQKIQNAEIEEAQRDRVAAVERMRRLREDRTANGANGIDNRIRRKLLPLKNKVHNI